MSTMPGPTQSELSKSSLPVKKPLVEVLTIDPANLRNDKPESERPLLGKRALLAFAPITFCIGVAVTWALQSYGNVAREMIARSFPQFGWLAPQAASVEQNSPGAIVPTALATPTLDQQQLNAMSLDLDAVQQRVDGIAASQEQMTREIAKLQAIEQYIHYKNLEPPSRPAPAAAPRAAARPPQAPAAR
jgi:hypothetical protein